jgi:hypothetical protein
MDENLRDTLNIISAVLACVSSLMAIFHALRQISDRQKKAGI